MASRLKLHLLCIDQQKDFTSRNGALPVPNGTENAERTAQMIERLQDKIDDIHVTMDSHRPLDISHPQWWVDESGNAPGPFTGVVLDGEQMMFLDYKTGLKRRARTRSMGALQRTKEYLAALVANGRYAHTIWPEHCLIGDEGHNLNPALAAAIHEWERKRYAISDIVTKGSNPWTEHFSAVQAEVPDPGDPSTQVNRALVQTIEEADIVGCTGEALSHCYANTLRDLFRFFNDKTAIGKLHLLTDATSSVGGFEHMGDAFLKEATSLGAKLSTTKDFLA